MSNIIEVNNLIKSFGDFTAVDNISFSIKKGTLFGFLGINGAGKSTTISILCTLSKMTSGSVKLCGYDIGKDDSLIKSKIGVVFQDNSLDDKLTVKQNLILRGALYENNRRVLQENIKNICNDLGINYLLNNKYRDLSGGQKRICDVARALIHKPEILFLDEPTTGLDPKTRRVLWESIEKIRKQNNMTIFLTTHYMEEAAKADNIAVINKGRIVAEGTPFKLKEMYSKDKLKLECNNKFYFRSLDLFKWRCFAYFFEYGKSNTFYYSKCIFSIMFCILYNIINSLISCIFLSISYSWNFSWICRWSLYTNGRTS
ncbi:MAG TPA: ABC transporter [Clostridium sp.]|nr:ABC transporter [Clostridium sp.]